MREERIGFMVMDRLELSTTGTGRRIALFHRMPRKLAPERFNGDLSACSGGPEKNSLQLSQRRQ
jgi:hypothetical protein